MGERTTVEELRLVVTVDDFERIRDLLGDDLGMTQRPAVAGEGGHVAIFEAGAATLEIVDEAQAAFIDEVEVGHRSAGALRVCLRVDDVDRATEALSGGEGLTTLAPPTETPFGSRNARFAFVPDAQLTLFG